MSFSSFDIYEMVKEFEDVIGMRVNNIYQINYDLRIKLYGKGRKDIFITKEAFYVTRYPRKAPKIAKTFAMLLRKYLRGLWLYRVQQVNFDRVVEFHFGYKGVTEYTLVAELFGKGNIILHADGEIIGVLRKEKWKDRILYPHRQYKYPPTRLPVTISFEEFQKLDIQSEKDLAINFNFGKLYAKEIFLRAQRADPEALYGAMHSFEKNPNIVQGTDVVPYDLLVYKDNNEKQFFPTFIEAVDEFYKPEPEETEPEEDRILISQKEALQEFETKSELYKKYGDLIYEQYTLVQDVLTTLMEARKEYEWKEIVRIVKESENPTAQKVTTIDYRNGKVTVDLGELVTLDVTLDINENAAYYYELAKKMDKKIEGAKKAMKMRKKKMEKEREEEKKRKPEPIKVLRKREWYEKFHWCFSSENYLILGGRDRRSNEMLVKKYLESLDVYMHADIQGAPSVVVKKGKAASEQTISEAAVFAAVYSSAWNHFGSLDCYWVNPDQVTKSPPAGEYLPAGAFFIAGSKNFLKVELEISLGVYEDKIMAGPESAVAAHTRPYVKVGFGDEKKERLAKQISKILDYSDIDEIVRALPGKGRILKNK
ncbi:MAG: NFACT family protein [Theionarchaea archaeon]|nr:NFACT family protein [Theionarchaea archaeon]